MIQKAGRPPKVFYSLAKVKDDSQVLNKVDGATLNETAKKILKKGLCGGKIIGLVITGSLKGFDVISEV